jgi:hypothetical protein
LQPAAGRSIVELTQKAWSDSRQRTASAIPSHARRAAADAVSVVPGATALTRIPCAATSRPRRIVKASIAAFDAVYCRQAGLRHIRGDVGALVGVRRYPTHPQCRTPPAPA